MTPELVTLVYYLTSLIRETNAAKVVASQAGLDTSTLETDGKSPHDVWHAILQAAETEGLLTALIAIVATRLPDNGKTKDNLIAMYADYTAAQRNNQAEYPKPPPGGQAGEYLSDLRADERRDERIYQMYRELTEIRVIVKGLEVQIAHLTSLVDSKSKSPSLTNTQFIAIIFTIIALSSIIFSALYYGVTT